MGLVAIEDFSAYLRRDFNDYDAYSAQMTLDGASDAVVEYCGWHIAPIVAETVIVDGTGTSIQTLPTLHLLSLNEITENGVPLDPMRIDFSDNGLLEKRSGGLWTPRRRGITADIHHGFTHTPNWLLTLICAVAGRAFSTPLGVQQESAGGETIIYSRPSGDTPPGAVALLPVDKRMLDRIAVPGAP